MANTEQLIREYLPGVRHMVLSTHGEHGPLATPLDFVVREDDLAVVCFRSPTTRLHVENIRSHDARVHGAVVRQHEFGERKTEGVSFVGSAALLGAGPERTELAQLFVDRLGAGDDIEARADTGGPQFCKIDVQSWFYYGAPEGGRPQTHVLPVIGAQ